MLIDISLAKITAKDTIILANNRQVLAFKKTWNKQKGASQLPKILTYKSYLLCIWNANNQSSSMRFIDSIESKYLISKSMLYLGQTLDNSLLEEVVKNYNYYKNHLIDLEKINHSKIGVCELFVSWIKDYEKNKKNLNLVDITDLPNIISKYKNITTPYIYGFKNLTPEQDLLFKTIGCQLISANKQNTNSTNKTFATTNDEILSAALWAQKIHKKNPLKQIVIVSPNLNNNYYQIKSVFDEVFFDTMKGIGKKTYNISLGLPLTRYPLVQDLLLILEVSKQIKLGKINSESFNKIITSAYIKSNNEEVSARFLLKNNVLSLSKNNFSLKKISKYINNCPQLEKIIIDIKNYKIEPKQSLGSWLLDFNQLLKIWGFMSTRALDSSEYQLFNKYLNTSLGLNKLSQHNKKVDVNRAVFELQNYLSQVIFQPQASKSPINILGSLEAQGLSFDYAWVIGMTSDFLPASLNSPAFIPLGIAIKQQIPFSSYELIIKDAKNTLYNLLNLAHKVIFSYAIYDNEDELQPSSLVKFDNITTIQKPVKTIKVKMQSLIDNKAPVLENKKISGGVSAIKDQTNCAFKGFARRLNIDDFDMPHIGLNSIEKGNLVHKVVEYIYQDIKDQTQLLGYDDEYLSSLINAKINKALRKYSTNGFTQLEKKRLFKLITKFINHEKQRDNFKILTTEKACSVNIAGLEFNTRLDRVDKVDKEEIIFDYKTGTVPVNPWLGELIKEPQLPIYAITNKVNGIAFIAIHSDKIKYIRLPNKTNFNWSEQLDIWKDKLTKASLDFQQGKAKVLPTKDACRYCNYDSLCRVEK